MLFTKPLTTGLFLVAISSLSFRANARAVDHHAATIARAELIATCNTTQSGCVDASWEKRAVILKLGEDGEGLGDIGEGGSAAGGSTAGIGGTSAGATAESGGTAEIGGVGEETPTAPEGDGAGQVAGATVAVGGQGRLAPVDITTQGYIIGPDPSGNPNIFRITKPAAGSMVLDTIEIDTENDAVGVLLANNKLDEAPNKLRLRQITTGLWDTKSGKTIGDLKSINYQIVTNEKMLEAFPKAYENMNKPFDNPPSPLTLLPTDPGFPTIKNAPFGEGVTKMLEQTIGLEGREITSITLFTDGTDVEFFF